MANPNHDSKGEFTFGTGSGKSIGLTLRAVKQRAFDGEPVPIKTHLSKQDVGKLGEQIITAHLQQMQGAKDARPLNAHFNNYPVDLVQDHGAIEVKTGLASNGKSAQQWRATIGQPGVAETKWLKTATPKAKAAWNQHKAQAILNRKAAALKQLGKQMGHTVKGSTMTAIINPDTRTADLYRFAGFHLRIAWDSPEAKKAYLGSYRY